MPRPDLCLFFSDQHDGRIARCAGDEIVRTPNLDALAAGGTSFKNAYTACPLCVPARTALLTGHSASQTGVFTNAGAIRGDQATFLHSLAAEGYETVLCGRMHLLGPDQRRGFTRRIFPDATPNYWGYSAFGEALGEHGGTLGMPHCLDIAGGGGVSPVLEYDKQVIAAAIDYLSRDHDRPQALVVGTYGPHFTYQAPEEPYRYYRDRVEPPPSFSREANYDNPTLSRRRQGADGDTARRARAAYYGMIETIDAQIGQVREAWGDYLARTGRTGVFAYSSDHGDTCGDHGIFGKQTHLEGSARIPMVFEGAGVAAGASLAGPVSLLDVSPTFCELGGATAPPAQAGLSLAGQLAAGRDQPDRAVMCEFMDRVDEQWAPSRSVRRGDWKLVHYACDALDDLLFDLAADPDELRDLSAERPQKAAELREIALAGWEPDRVAAVHAERVAHHHILRRWTDAVQPEQSELWLGYAGKLSKPTVE